MGEDLRYCEFYTPFDCCRQIPCRRTDARVVFQKNHDLDLGLDPHLPGCLYVVQYRSPLLEALSDRELLESVSPEFAGDEEHTLVWLARKVASTGSSTPSGSRAALRTASGFRTRNS